MAQHQHGHLPENHMLMICKSYDKDVFSKFIKDKDGLWYNERLEIEIIKRKNYSKSRSENRNSTPKEKIISLTYDPHMENENRNEIEIKLKGAFDEIYLDQQKPKWPQKDFDFEYKTFLEKVRGSPDHYREHTSSGIRLAFQSQLRNAKNKINGNRNNNQTNIRRADATVEGGVPFGNL